MSSGLERRRAAFSPEHWLCHCEGFLVAGPGGPVGFVEEVRFSSRLDRPEALVVQAGQAGGCRLVVPVGEIEALVPSAERILLRTFSGATPPGASS